MSSDGARRPAWDTQGTLHYWQTPDDKALRAVRTAEIAGQLTISALEAVWRHSLAVDRIVNPAAGARYDLEPTGTRFLVLERAASAPGPALAHPMVVLGWRADPGSVR